MRLAHAMELLRRRAKEHQHDRTITPSSSDSVPTQASASVAKLPVTLDTEGRVRPPREQRRVILTEVKRSGISAAQFARRTGLKYSTFAYWLQRYARPKWARPKSHCIIPLYGTWLRLLADNRTAANGRNDHGFADGHGFMTQAGFE